MKNLIIIFFIKFIPIIVMSQTYNSVYKIGATEEFFNKDYGDSYINQFAQVGYKEIFNKWKYNIISDKEQILVVSDISSIGYDDTMKYNDGTTSISNYVGKPKQNDNFPKYLLNLKNNKSHTIYENNYNGIDSIIITNLTRHELIKTNFKKSINNYECVKYFINDTIKKYEVIVWVAEQLPSELNPFGFKNLNGGVVKIEYQNGLYQELISYKINNSINQFPKLSESKSINYNNKNDIVASWNFFKSKFDKKILFE